jgi:hypothetical protein
LSVEMLPVVRQTMCFVVLLLRSECAKTSAPST